MKKREDGRYCKQVLVGYHPDGRRKMVNIYGKTIKEVEKKEREIRFQIDEGIYVEDNKITVGEWAKTWLEVYKKGFKSNTYNYYKYSLSAHAGEIKDIYLKDLKQAHLQKIINQLISKGNVRSAEIFKSTVSQMLEKAVENELLSKNVAKKIQLPPKQKKAKRALSDEEVADILDLELPLTTRCFIGIMLYCGLRRGETWALKKEDVDLENKALTVNKTIYFDTTGSRRLMVGTPKSKASNRVIPIPDILVEDLKKYIPSINGEQLFVGELMKEHQFRMMWKGFVSI